MKKTALILSAVLALALLAGCASGPLISPSDSSGSTTSSATTPAAQTTAPAVTAGITLPDAPIYYYQDHPMKHHTDEEGYYELLRAYFDSDRYAADHPDCPDAIWFGDGSFFIIPEVEDTAPVDFFLFPELLEILSDDERLAVVVHVLEVFEEERAAERKNLEDHGFPVIGVSSTQPCSYVILVKKDQIDALKEILPVGSGVHYIIREASYPDTVFDKA